MDAGNKPSKTDAQEHAIFTNPAWGVRAGIMVLHTYFFKHNLRTIAQILARWAPETDTIGSLPGAPKNSPKEYSAFVSGQMGGISYNQTLDIFDADKTIGNLSRLRDLFSAMAGYEIGQVDENGFKDPDGKRFKVPEKDFNAGAELFEPGIKTEGTESTFDNAVVLTPAEAKLSKWKIGGSVGRSEKGAENSEKDVKTVQQMLRNAAAILGDHHIDPGGIDGVIAPKSKDSDTVRAIETFQSRSFAIPDGIIDVDGRTWRELVGVLLSGAQDSTTLPETPGAVPFFFPFKELPAKDWTNAPRSFAANRDNGTRAHAGCDLYFPVGTVIHAIADGTVIRGPYDFYADTYAIEIDHGTFLARYGEVQQSTFVREGDRVVAGQPIAKVGKLTGLTISMLHLELYDKSAHGRLTVPASLGAIAPNGRPFMRRRDLIDPTAKLNAWSANLPGAPLPGPAPSAPPPSGVPTTGFCIRLVRKREEKRPSKPYPRTVGEYECFWDGVAIPALRGQMVERGGPGDNTTAIGNNRDLRIRQGVYRLMIHNGTKYKTYGYAANGDGSPKPGLLLNEDDTGERSAILIHPGADYVSSIGCLNPATGLTNASSAIDFSDSRKRVIAIIEGIKAKMGGAFPKSGMIPDAVILIEGLT
jgi:hypothetical protein